jgi:Na+/melibiose symporter-like transporter
MKRKPTWWKLYVFAAVACVALFLFPPTNQALLILWMVVMYGGIAFWLKTNESQIAETPDYHRTIVKAPVSEFFDEDRVYMQQLGTEIPDDTLRGNPHEAA